MKCRCAQGTPKLLGTFPGFSLVPGSPGEAAWGEYLRPSAKGRKVPLKKLDKYFSTNELFMHTGDPGLEEKK